MAYSNCGAAWIQKQDYDKAIADVDQAIRLDPKLAEAYTNRGTAWFNKKEYNKAIVDDYDQAIQLDPHDALAYSNRGGAWLEKQDYDKAIADFDQAIQLDPKLAGAYGDRGCLWPAKEQYDKAIVDLDQAIRLRSQTRRCLHQPRRPMVQEAGVRQGDRRTRPSDPTRSKVAMAHSNRGAAWLAKREYEKAIVDLDNDPPRSQMR